MTLCVLLCQLKTVLVLKYAQKMSVEADWSFRIFFYFSNKVCIFQVDFFANLSSSFHRAVEDSRKFCCSPFGTNIQNVLGSGMTEANV